MKMKRWLEFVAVCSALLVAGATGCSSDDGKQTSSCDLNSENCSSLGKYFDADECVCMDLSECSLTEETCVRLGRTLDIGTCSCVEKTAACTQNVDTCAAEGKSFDAENCTCIADALSCDKSVETCAAEGKSFDADNCTCIADAPSCDKSVETCAAEGKSFDAVNCTCVAAAPSCDKSVETCAAEGKSFDAVNCTCIAVACDNANCETEESVDDCGTSHLKCKVEHAQNRCEDGLCAFTCEEGWTSSLDGKSCEPLGDPSACGQEQITCQSGIPNAIDLCVRDNCTFKCAPNFHLSQDSKACEPDTILACGSHDNVCNNPHGVPTCMDGVCQYVCSEGYHPTGGNRSCEEDCKENICENVLDEETSFHRGVIKGICGDDGRIKKVNNPCPDTDLCEMLETWYKNKTKNIPLVITVDPNTMAERFITEEIVSYNLTASGVFDMNHCKSHNNITFSHPSCSTNNECAIANTVDEKLYRKRCFTFTDLKGTQHPYLVSSGYLADTTNVLIFDKNPACSDDYYVVPSLLSQYMFSDQNIESIPCDPNDRESYPMKCYKTEYIYNDSYNDYTNYSTPECRYTFGNWYECKQGFYTWSVGCSQAHEACNPDIDVHSHFDISDLCIPTECVWETCDLSAETCAAEGKSFNAENCTCVTIAPSCDKSAATCASEGKVFDAQNCQCVCNKSAVSCAAEGKVFDVENCQCVCDKSYETCAAEDKSFDAEHCRCVCNKNQLTCLAEGKVFDAANCQCVCTKSNESCAAEGKTFDSANCQCVCNKSATTCAAEGKDFDAANCACIPRPTCNEATYENYCDGNTLYSCFAGEVSSVQCDKLSLSGAGCAVRKSDGYASCVISCSYSSLLNNICSNDYGGLIDLDGIYAISGECSEKTSGGNAYFISYELCDDGCANGVCKTESGVCTKSDASCAAEGKAFDSATCSCVPCDKATYNNYCDGNTLYYCDAGEVKSVSCASYPMFECAARKSDNYASCVLSCSAGTPDQTMCTDDNYFSILRTVFGSLFNFDGLYAIRYQCSQTKSGNYAYFPSYEFCDYSCENGVCKSEPVAGAPCDRNTYEGGCSADGKTRFYCGSDYTLVYKSCTGSSFCVINGNNSSSCKTDVVTDCAPGGTEYCNKVCKYDRSEGYYYSNGTVHTIQCSNYDCTTKNNRVECEGNILPYDIPTSCEYHVSPGICSAYDGKPYICGKENIYYKKSCDKYCYECPKDNWVGCGYSESEACAGHM